MKHTLIFLLLVSLVTACTSTTSGPTRPAAIPVTPVASTQQPAGTPTFISTKLEPSTCTPIEIKLPAPWDDARSEFSGATIAGGYLYLLPQYPRRQPTDLAKGSLPRIKIPTLQDAIAAGADQAIEIETVNFDDSGVATRIAGFEGFEAVAIQGEAVFLSIESRSARGMMGYLVRGKLSSNSPLITLDPETLVQLPPQNSSLNASDEALLLWGNGLLTFYEQNGPLQNPEAIARFFDSPYHTFSAIRMPSVNFRITDAAPADSESHFYVMNYFFPGDEHLLPEAGAVPAIPDPQGFEPGTSFARILTLEFDGQEIAYNEAETTLILPPDGRSAYNWEGLAYLPGQGYFIVTDSFPSTFLGFCPVK